MCVLGTEKQNDVYCRLGGEGVGIHYYDDIDAVRSPSRLSVVG